MRASKGSFTFCSRNSHVLHGEDSRMLPVGGAGWKLLARLSMTGSPMEEFLAAVLSRVAYLVIEALIVRLVRAFTAVPSPAQA